MAVHLSRALLYALPAPTVRIVALVLAMASARSADAQVGYSRAVDVPVPVADPCPVRGTKPGWSKLDARNPNQLTTWNQDMTVRYDGRRIVVEGSAFAAGVTLDICKNSWSAADPAAPASAQAPPAAVPGGVPLGAATLLPGIEASWYHAFATASLQNPAGKTIAVSPRGAPSPRSGYVLATTRTHALIWGGAGPGASGGDAVALSDGAMLDLQSGGWQPVSSKDAPSARYSPVVLSRGNLLVIWGGHAHGGRTVGGRVVSGLLSNGAVYDLTRDTWTPIPEAGAPVLKDPAPAAALVGDWLIVVGSAAGAFNLKDRVWISLKNAPRIVLGQSVRTYVVDETHALMIDPLSPWRMHLLDLSKRSFAPIKLPAELVGLQLVGTVWTGRRLFALGGFALGSNGCDRPGREPRPCDPHRPAIERWNSGWVYVP